MIPIVGLSFFGLNSVEPTNPSVNNFYRTEVRNAIYDQLEFISTTDIVTNTKSLYWQTNHRLLAMFNGDLEAGNLQNNGLTINSFAVKRRKTSELNNLTLGYIPFENNATVEYTDNTPATDTYIYSIVPVSDQLEGIPQEVVCGVSFAGGWIVDKSSDTIIALDKFMSESDVQIQRNDGRTLIETMSQYPQIYRWNKKYSTMNVSGLIYIDPQDTTGNNTFKEYQKILALIDQNKPLIYKNGSGDLFVVEVSAPQKSTPQLAHQGRDYATISFELVEIMNEQTYFSMY